MSWNSALSAPGAKYLIIDTKDMHLADNEEMDEFEYFQTHTSYFPQQLIEACNLQDFVDDNGMIYWEVRKGMHGLPQAGVLANKALVKHMDKHGYYPVNCTNGLWKCRHNNIVFTLVVDDFGVKHNSEQEASHLINALKDKHAIDADYSGSLCVGVELKWNYKIRVMDYSMPSYVPNLLKRIKYEPKDQPQNAPAPCPTIACGQKKQLASQDTTEILSPEEIRFTQSANGSLLCFGRMCDNTILVATNDTSTQQSKATKQTRAKLEWLLDYVATNPNPVNRVCASKMQLWISSDASYLTVSKARSRIAGFHYLSDAPNDSIPLSEQKPPINSPTHVEVGALKMVATAASEAELGAACANAKIGIATRRTLEEMGHPQVAANGTPLEMDNSTAHGIMHESINQKRSKAIDMRYYWLRDQLRLKLFNYYWQKGQLNIADYCSKHFPAPYHIEQKKWNRHQLVDGLCKLCVLSDEHKKYIETAYRNNTKKSNYPNK